MNPRHMEPLTVGRRSVSYRKSTTSVLLNITPSPGSMLLRLFALPIFILNPLKALQIPVGLNRVDAADFERRHRAER